MLCLFLQSTTNFNYLRMKNYIYIFAALVLIAACKPNSSSKNYDTAPMLKNLAENIILPNYISLETKAISLNDAVLVLKNTPNSTNLADAQIKFLEAYKAWQKVSPFQFGPAEDIALNTINIYPTDTAQISANISSGTYNLETAANIDASGFPALDFLLFYGTESEILSRFTNVNFASYAVAASLQIRTKTSTVKTDWQTSYANTFMTSTDLSVGGSLSLLTNALVLNFEKDAREAKIGIPAGVRTLNQIVPQNVEAFYSKNSILLAKEHIAGFKALYEGNNGASFKSILIGLDKETLAENISTHILNIETSLNTLSDPFDAMLNTNNEPALAAYAEYQKLLPLLKVDMTAALGLLITYSDSDGD